MTTLTRRLAGLVILGSAAMSLVGCEVIATPDRGEVSSSASSSSSGGKGGASGAGGADAGGGGAGGSGGGVGGSGGGAGGSGGGAGGSGGGAGGSGGGAGGSGGGAGGSGGGAGGSNGGAGGSGGGAGGSNGGAGGSGGGAGGGGVGGFGGAGSGLGGSGGAGGAGAVCGDGTISGAESCDDGNQNNGDCCSSACGIEAGCEIEPNNTAQTANSAAAIQIADEIKGFIGPASDVDFFRVVVPAGFTATLSGQTFDGFLGSTCLSHAIDSAIDVFDDQGGLLAGDDSSGTGFCAHVVAKALVPGNYHVALHAGPNNPLFVFDYVLNLTLTLYPCGDSVIDPEQQCDDGNQINGDGCSDSCRIEQLIEIEPNNSCAQAEGPYTPTSPVLVGGAISPVGDGDFYAINVPVVADLTIETYDGSGPGACDIIDTKIELRAPDCSTVLASDDDDGFNQCSKLDPAAPSDSGVRHMAPGTYYAYVHQANDSAPIPAYSMKLAFTALCGDGVVQGAEECDGLSLPTATCQASCDRVPICGDTFIDAPEQCDDGGTQNGDGCSAACAVESLLAEDEAAGNDTFAGADANPVQLTGDVHVQGSLPVVGDKDIFRLTLAQPGVARLETFDGTLVDCAFGTTTTLRLFDAAFAQLYTDSISGIAGCSALVVNLQAGVYYVQVEEFQNNGTVPSYSLEVKLQSSAGAEIEPDDAFAQATSLTSSLSDFYVLGGHQVDVDADYYAVNVPAGSSIRAEIIEGDAETCESNGVDSRLTLYNPALAQLQTDNNTGRGNCSLIDGTGNNPLHMPAHNLPGGVYYILVNAGGIGAAAQFDYRLDVAVRSP